MYWKEISGFESKYNMSIFNTFKQFNASNIKTVDEINDSGWEESLRSDDSTYSQTGDVGGRW